jgi:hypothetical protein
MREGSTLGETSDSNGNPHTQIVEMLGNSGEHKGYGVWGKAKDPDDIKLFAHSSTKEAWRYFFELEAAYSQQGADANEL